MAPPINKVSTRSSRADTTPSLSDTLAPPRTATNGRGGEFSRLEKTCYFCGPAAARLQRASGRAGRPLRRGPGGRIRRRRRRRDPGRPRGGRRSAGRSPPHQGRSAGCRAAPTPGASSASRARTGATSKRGSGFPLGRPRWVQAVTEAPRSVSQSSVGRAARIRKSSVMSTVGQRAR